MSSEPMIAATSASICPRLKKSIACRWANVRHQVDGKLALGRLDRSVDLAGGNVMTLAVELEMVDSGLHRALHLGAQRRHDLVVPNGNRSLTFGQPQLLQALFHDAHRLPHLLHPYEIAVVAVPVLADRDVKIERGIALIGLCFAQIPSGAGTAHHDAGKAPPPGVCELDHADSDVALLEDAIFRQQPLDVVANFEERIAERPDVLEKLWRQVLVHAPDAKIVRVHASARGAFVKHHQLLALLEAPERRRERADVQRLRRHIEEMREQAPDLAIEDADELPAPGHRDAKQLLGCQTERVFLVHRRDVIEPVEIGQRLQIGLVLDQLLGPTVQKTDMRVDALDDLTVELQYEAQHAVSRGMLRPEIEGEVAQGGFGHNGLASARFNAGR